MEQQQNSLPRAILIYGACIAVALVLGYLLVNPMVKKNQLVVGAILLIIMSPVLLKWYHPLLIFTWNAAIIFFFLPGKPNIVFLMSIAGFGVAALSRCLTDKARFHHDRWLTLAVLAFVGAVLFTAYSSGGIGIRSAGSSTYGGASGQLDCVTLRKTCKSSSSESFDGFKIGESIADNSTWCQGVKASTLYPQTVVAQPISPL